MKGSSQLAVHPPSLKLRWTGSRPQGIILLTIAFLSLGPGLSLAQQTNLGASNEAAPWLKRPVSARAAAMGDAFGALSDDLSALDFNPAGLYRIEEPQLVLSHDTWFQGLSMERGLAGIPLGSGGLGLGFDYADFGPIDSFSVGGGGVPVAGGSLSPNAWDGRLGLGFYLSDNLFLGGSFTYLQQSLTGTTQSTEAGGLGLLVKVFPKLSFGLSADNLGGKLGGFNLASDLKASLAYQSGVWGKTHALNLVVDADYPLDSSRATRVGIGAEYWFKGVLALRAGEQVSDDLAGTGLDGFSLGAGVNLGPFQLDYAFVNNGDLGASHLFSLGLGWEGEAGWEAVKARKMEVRVEMLDFKTGSLKMAVFDMKPLARTDIKAWRLDITDRRGNLLRTYEGRGVPPREVVWDGKDSKGNVVTEGILARYRFRSTDDGVSVQMVSAETIFASIRNPTAEAPMLGASQRNVQFALNSAELDPDFAQQLDLLAAVLIQQPNDHVLLLGYASQEGGEEHNRVLSEQRAKAVADRLAAKGVPLERVTALGKGVANPLSASDTEESRAKNRRVEIKVVTGP